MNRKRKKKRPDLPIVPIKNTADYQRMKLQRLMANVEKPVTIPVKPREKNLPPPPDFVRNIMGSSAGAGSGEFHVYRHLRRKEYARQKTIVEQAKFEEQEAEFKRKIEERQRIANEKTAKKRAKRLKQKANRLKKKGQVISKKEESSSSSSESEEEAEKCDGINTSKSDEPIGESQNLTSVDETDKTSSISTSEQQPETKSDADATNTGISSEVVTDKVEK